MAAKKLIKTYHVVSFLDGSLENVERERERESSIVSFKNALRNLFVGATIDRFESNGSMRGGGEWGEGGSIFLNDTSHA